MLQVQHDRAGIEQKATSPMGLSRIAGLNIDNAVNCV
jgi:hypothetical protein